LFGKGQPLDAEKYFVILPDNVGHGRSSKPSDGLHMKFPKYRYTDMVKLQHELVTKELGLTNLELVMGTSMGAMHTWNWGYMYPGFAAGLVPLASNPVEIGGRNRVWRKFLIDAIEHDPTWMNGEYKEQPRGLASAIGFTMMATSVPLQWQKQFPTIAAADKYVADQVAARSKNTDANDMLYHYHAIEDYNPAPHLSKITAPLLAINSADDFVNPPELPMMQELIKQVKRGRFILLPITDDTRGHGTHSLPAIWGGELARFLKEIEQPR
jgi:homoserine O-acetyltransferase